MDRMGTKARKTLWELYDQRDDSKEERWIMKSRSKFEENTYERIARLALLPEPDYLSCLDSHKSKTSPVKFYKEYLDDTPDLGDAVAIHWSVAMEKNGFWLSPYVNPAWPSLDTWYSQWSHPISEDTGEPVKWHTLPIHHRFPEFWDELGWSLGPFQRRFYFTQAFDDHFRMLG